MCLSRPSPNLASDFAFVKPFFCGQRFNALTDRYLKRTKTHVPDVHSSITVRSLPAKRTLKAAMVSVGLAVPLVGNTADPST